MTSAIRREQYSARKSAGICVYAGCKKPCSETSIRCESHRLMRNRKKAERFAADAEFRQKKRLSLQRWRATKAQQKTSKSQEQQQ